MLLVIAIVFIIIIVVLYMISPLLSPSKMEICGQHVLITGGSSGIGKALAVEAVLKGANVTLLARNENRLIESKKHVEQYCKSTNKQRVVCISVDVASDYAAVEKAIKEAEAKQGPVAMLINCAGVSTSGRFEDTSLEDFRRLLDINYMGSVYATRAVVVGMKARERGRIVFVSSQAGQIGLFGYTAYAASKFALRGLAESLQMEVKPYNIQVTMAFPPDTDTPGYVEENRCKPKETKILSEMAGLFQPEYVAKIMIEKAMAGSFQCYLGFDGFILSQVTSGMSPPTSVLEVMQQAVLMGPLRLVGVVYHQIFNRIVLKCKKERDHIKQN